MHSCIRAFVHSCIRAFVHSCIRACVYMVYIYIYIYILKKFFVLRGEKLGAQLHVLSEYFFNPDSGFVI